MSKKVGKSAKELLAEGKPLRIQLTFTDDECELYDFLHSQPKMNKFIKSLILREMCSDGGDDNNLIHNQEETGFTRNIVEDQEEQDRLLDELIASGGL